MSDATLNQITSMSRPELFAWLIRQQRMDFRHPIISYVFVITCGLDNMTRVREMINVFGRSINIHSNRDDAFRTVCRNGSMTVLRWLIHHVTDPEAIREGFEEAVANGVLGVVQFLLEHKKSQIDIRRNQDKAFRLAREGEFWIIAQMLVNHYPEFYEWKDGHYEILDRVIIPRVAVIFTDAIPKECLICCDGGCDVVTKCRHAFCYKCLRKWTQTCAKCPTCREPVTECWAVLPAKYARWETAILPGV